MADVQVQQTPDRGGSGAVWALGVIAVILVIVVLWFLFADRDAPAREQTDIDINVPQTTTQIETPRIEVPDKIEIDLPEKVDINVSTDTQPPPQRRTGTQ